MNPRSADVTILTLRRIYLDGDRVWKGLDHLWEIFNSLPDFGPDDLYIPVPLPHPERETSAMKAQAPRQRQHPKTTCRGTVPLANASFSPGIPPAFVDFCWAFIFLFIGIEECLPLVA